METLELVLGCCLVGGFILFLVLGIIFGVVVLVKFMLDTIKGWRTKDGK